MDPPKADIHEAYRPGMTWYDLVKAVAASHGCLDIDEMAADVILWEYTAFPMADAGYIAKQLDRYFAGYRDESEPFYHEPDNP